MNTPNQNFIIGPQLEMVQSLHATGLINTIGYVPVQIEAPGFTSQVIDPEGLSTPDTATLYWPSISPHNPGRVYETIAYNTPSPLTPAERLAHSRELILNGSLREAYLELMNPEALAAYNMVATTDEKRQYFVKALIVGMALITKTPLVIVETHTLLPTAPVDPGASVGVLWSPTTLPPRLALDHFKTAVERYPDGRV